LSSSFLFLFLFLFPFPFLFLFLFSTLTPYHRRNASPPQPPARRRRCLPAALSLPLPSTATHNPFLLPPYHLNLTPFLSSSSPDLTTLPPQYIQPPEERLESLKITPSSSIPIIDVSKWDDPRVQDSIFEAATQLGFFTIINHDIPNQVLGKVIDAAHAFYSLPNDERRVYWKGNSPSATVFYTTSFSPFAEKVLEWKDFLMF
ncbi:Feruloyl CoA ortho-hydroxylase F6H1-2, partial [Linum perenne]